MRVDEEGSTNFLLFPYEEAGKTIKALGHAEKADDLEALKWCARRLAWLDDEAVVTNAVDNFYQAQEFTRDWARALKTDPPPDSIRAIIDQIDQGEPEPPTAADAGEALDTVLKFFKANEACLTVAVFKGVDALRSTINTVEAKAV